MTVALGIHCGHESSCAVVRDGRLVSAIQQERVTRRKYDGQEFLSSRLPIEEALGAAGLTIDDVDVIVSSFQAAGPSAVGYQRPLVSPGFSVFDPFDVRHRVVSHHLAHAASAVYPSGFPEVTVLVSDSAGTTSWDGADYNLPFGQFFRFSRSAVVSSDDSSDNRSTNVERSTAVSSAQLLCSASPVLRRHSGPLGESEHLGRYSVKPSTSGRSSSRSLMVGVAAAEIGFE